LLADLAGKSLAWENIRFHTSSRARTWVSLRLTSGLPDLE